MQEGGWSTLIWIMSLNKLFFLRYPRYPLHMDEWTDTIREGYIGGKSYERSKLWSVRSPESPKKLNTRRKVLSFFVQCHFYGVKA